MFETIPKISAPTQYSSYYIRFKNIHKTYMYIQNKVYICTMYSSELIKGTLKTIILKLLSENDKMYGYEITQKVKELTDGKIQLTEGALYPTLHALEADGILTTKAVNVGNRIRKYYTITKTGKKMAKEKVSEFREFMNTMVFLLDLKLNIG
jgi:PadR family transcriptional regulator, regulatory protein PadR